MTEEQTLPDRTPKTKRSRKPATPRTRKPKDPGILAIEAESKAKKDEYRKAQASQGILTRITDKLVPKLTEAHRQALYDALSEMVTPALTGIGTDLPLPTSKTVPGWPEQ